MRKEHAHYQFGEFALDPVAKVLFREGQPVHLTRKAVETLLVLVEHPGQVLTKDEIMAVVWAGRVVDEANLAQNIAVIRRALGVTKDSPAYIETFAGRGYRLQGPVSAPVHTVAAAMPEVAVPTSEAPATSAKQPKVIWAAPLALALLAIGWFTIPRRPFEPPAFRVSAATRLPGTEYQPALSPDGKVVAFLWSDDAAQDPTIWISVVGESSPKPLIAGSGHHSSPVWSSEGSTIFFLRSRPNETEIVRKQVSDTTERVVASIPAVYGFDTRMLDVSGDGKRLVVSEPSGLTLLAATGTERKQLTRPGPAYAGDVDPHFSPDGSQVSFLRVTHRSQQELFVVGVEGGEPRQITSLGKRISSHDWNRTGTEVLIASDHTGEFRLWRVPLTGAATLTPAGVYGDSPIQFSIARKADMLVYSTFPQTRNIWRYDLQQSVWKRMVASTAQDASPVYSPDGSRMCFRSDRSGEEQLWVAGADGSNPVQITRNPVKPSVGRWSPDGRSIVFNNPRTFDISVAEYRGSGWSVRSTGAKGVHPVFSADGRYIFAGGLELIRIPAEGGPAVAVAATKGEALATSADGRYLYFVREANDSTAWRLPLAGGGEPERAFQGLVPGCTSCWALASTGVYYLGIREQSFHRQAIYFHSFGGGRDTVVAEYPEALWPQGSGPFSLSPDGRHLLCVRVNPSDSDLMLVTPFR